MTQIQLTGLGNNKEIENISGKGVSFKKIKIPGENCSNFFIRYEIRNLENNSTNGGLIVCVVSPYQRDVTQVILHQSIIIPDNSTFNIHIESVLLSKELL